MFLIRIVSIENISYPDRRILSVDTTRCTLLYGTVNVSDCDFFNLLMTLLYSTVYVNHCRAQQEQSRAEQSRAEQSRAEQSRAEQSVRFFLQPYLQGTSAPLPPPPKLLCQYNHTSRTFLLYSASCGWVVGCTLVLLSSMVGYRYCITARSTTQIPYTAHSTVLKSTGRPALTSIPVVQWSCGKRSF
jgi:hypothetical protein